MRAHLRSTNGERGCVGHGPSEATIGLRVSVHHTIASCWSSLFRNWRRIFKDRSILDKNSRIIPRLFDHAAAMLVRTTNETLDNGNVRSRDQHGITTHLPTAQYKKVLFLIEAELLHPQTGNSLPTRQSTSQILTRSNSVFQSTEKAIMDSYDVSKFALLREENQQRILQQIPGVLDGETVSLSPERDGLVITAGTVASTVIAIPYLSRPRALALLKNQDGEEVRLNLDLDTVKVFDTLPEIAYTSAWHDSYRKGQYPIQKLLFSEENNPTTSETMADAATRTFALLLAGRLRLNLKSWPLLKQATIAYDKADLAYLLETYGTQGIGTDMRGFNKPGGGMWAGFRYYPDSNPPRLQFSPLHYEEIKDDFGACKNLNPVKNEYPAMVIRVFIVRHGEKAPSGGAHTCWEEVVGAAAGTKTEQEDQIRIKAMWDLVRVKFANLKDDERSTIALLS